MIFLINQANVYLSTVYKVKKFFLTEKELFQESGEWKNEQKTKRRLGRLVGFNDISTSVGYLMPNPFLYKLSVLFQTIQFTMSIQFNCQNISISNYSVYSNSSNSV